jgi:hypothetical protein
MSKQNLALMIVLIIAGLSILSVVGLFIFNSINKGDSLEEFPMNDSSFPAEENDNTSSGCDEQNQNVVFDAYMEDLSNEWQQWAPGEDLEAETIGLYFMPVLLDYGDKINKVYYDKFLGEIPQGSVLLQKSLSIEEVKNMVEQANQQYNVVASVIPRSDYLYKDGILSVVLDLETIMATNPFHNILSMNYDFKNGKEILLYDILNNQWQDAIRQRIWDEVKNMEDLPPAFSVDRFPCLDSALGYGDSFLISSDGITIFIPGDRLDPYFCWENRGFTFNFEELKDLLNSDSDIVQRITGDHVSDNKNISLRNLKIQSALNQAQTQAEIIIGGGESNFPPL